MMLGMGWAPGQTLGKSVRGLKKPIASELLSRVDREGLGYRVSVTKIIQVQEQIVDALKLKAEHSDKNQHDNISSVFEEDNQNQAKEMEVRADIIVQIYDYEVTGLVDTGSDITCISEEFWKVLKSHYSNIPVMPVKSIQIKTAVGHKSAEIRKMALLPIKFRSISLDIGFLIVPNLTKPFILGIDWMAKNEIVISLKKGERGMWLEHENGKYLVKFLENSLEVEESNVILGKSGSTHQDLSNIKTGIELDGKDRQKLENLLQNHGSHFRIN